MLFAELVVVAEEDFLEDLKSSGKGKNFGAKCAKANAKFREVRQRRGFDWVTRVLEIG